MRQIPGPGRSWRSQHPMGSEEQSSPVCGGHGMRRAFQREIYAWKTLLWKTTDLDQNGDDRCSRCQLKLRFLEKRQNLMKSSHRSRGKFAIFGHHHFLWRNRDVRVVGYQRFFKKKINGPAIGPDRLFSIWRSDLHANRFREAQKRSVQRSGLPSRAIFLWNLFAFTGEGPLAFEWLCLFPNVLGNVVDLEIFE